MNTARSQNPRHIDGYASGFVPSDRPNLTPSCARARALKREVILARALRTSIIGIALLSVAAQAELTGSIVHSFRPLRMLNSEAFAPKDYFLDLGEQDGVTAGSLFEVYRILYVKEPKSGGDFIKVPLGELQVTKMGLSVSVARQMSVTKAAVALHESYFLVGDVVELKTGLPFR